MHFRLNACVSYSVLCRTDMMYFIFRFQGINVCKFNPERLSSANSEVLTLTGHIYIYIVGLKNHVLDLSISAPRHALSSWLQVSI